MLHLKLKVKLEKYTFSVHGKKKLGCSTCNITRIRVCYAFCHLNHTKLYENCDLQACLLSCLLTTIFKRK